mmetsp:Transcript_13462/g.24366  ORF Transcript_13462/g.24366 Transcript_13462/m.24366 type:complete len:80 (-) Transcript_13462:72-311(-)
MSHSELLSGGIGNPQSLNGIVSIYGGCCQANTTEGGSSRNCGHCISASTGESHDLQSLVNVAPMSDTFFILFQYIIDLV